VCSIRAQIDAPAGNRWEEFSAFGMQVDADPALPALCDRALEALLTRLKPAISRLAVAAVVEDYVVFRIDRITDESGSVVAPDMLDDQRLIPLLVGESRPLSIAARRDALANRFSYYSDDFAIITWDNALVVEPRRGDRDVEYVLEFANAQLLELRLFDAQLSAELPALHDRVTSARGRRAPLTRRFRSILAELQTRVADITETVERVDNAFTVTDDVYLARIYSAALDLFRERNWRRGIERKLQILRDTYAMLNAEAQAARGELLELAVLLLFVIEVVLGLIH
jgi:hypothetical protein